MEKAKVDLEFNIDPLAYSGFLNRHNQRWPKIVREKFPLSKILEKKLAEDELELLRQTEREIDECMGSGRYEEAKHLTDLIKSQFGKAHLLAFTSLTDNTATPIKHPEFNEKESIAIILEKCTTSNGSAFELCKLVISHVQGMVAAYDTDDLTKLRDSTDEDGETDQMVVARRIFRYIPQQTINFIIKVLLFFPVFKSKFGCFSVNDSLRLRVILWVYSQTTFYLGTVTLPEFYNYLTDTFPQDPPPN
jgi:hypothetical protein